VRTPDGPGYQEKFYFNPGDTGFKVFDTTQGKLGIGICWDQWFPECARCLALLGAELILYPTAIGSEPHDPTLNSRGHWTRVMQGHAGSNLVPIVCSNRVGVEDEIEFYGGSFIADHTGDIVEHFGNGDDDDDDDVDGMQTAAGYLVHTFDLDDIARRRVGWGVFRDRRPELYWPIATLDGRREGGGGGGGGGGGEGGVGGDGCGGRSSANIVTPTMSSHISSSRSSDDGETDAGPTSAEIATAPPAGGHSMPPEWSDQAAVWMAWPHMESVWSGNCEPARRAVLDLISAVAQYQTVKLLVRLEDLTTARRRLHAEWDVIPVCASYDDIWLRDTGPTFLRGGGGDGGGSGLTAVCWTFNGWGSKHPRVSRDVSVGGQIASLACASSVVRCPHVLEGGSFHTDGNGTFITTEECLLHPNRGSFVNIGTGGDGDADEDGMITSILPDGGGRRGGGVGRSKEEMNSVFEKYLHAKKVIWLPHGVDGDDDTDGHVDNVAAFIAPRKLVLTMPTDESHPQYVKSMRAKEILEGSTNAAGDRLQVVCLPHPTGPRMVISEEDVAGLERGANERLVGTKMAGSYVNFYIGNGFVVMPKFGCPEDGLAREILQNHFPGRKVIAVDTRSILLGGGNIHCITQQEPAGWV
jgi:agmatine/peptidylarginine deiminase